MTRAKNFFFTDEVVWLGRIFTNPEDKIRAKIIFTAGVVSLLIVTFLQIPKRYDPGKKLFFLQMKLSGSYLY